MESSKLAKLEQKPVIKVFKRKPCDSGRKNCMYRLFDGNEFVF